jgi:hypothetical protein
MGQLGKRQKCKVVIIANFTNCLAAGIVALDVNTLSMTSLEGGSIMDDSNDEWYGKNY